MGERAPLLPQALLDKPKPFFALVLSPTRELALQIAQQARLERLALLLSRQRRPTAELTAVSDSKASRVSVLRRRRSSGAGLGDQRLCQARRCTRLLGASLTCRTPMQPPTLEQFEALGAVISVRCAVLVGGIDMMAQAIAIAKRPHVIVGTPGRVVDHLTNTKARYSNILQYPPSFRAPQNISTKRHHHKIGHRCSERRRPRYCRASRSARCSTSSSTRRTASSRWTSNRRSTRSSR